MKTFEVTEEFYFAAKLLADYIDSQESEYDSLEEFIQEGNDVKDHILYHTSIVGGWEDSFQEFVGEVKEQIEVEDLNTKANLWLIKIEI